MTKLERLAEDYGLKVTLDEDGRSVLRGQSGLIYDPGAKVRRLNLLYSPDPKERAATREERWRCWKRALVSLGFTIRYDFDSEGMASFNPANPRQTLLAFTVAGMPRRAVLVAVKAAEQALRVKRLAARGERAGLRRAVAPAGVRG